MNGKFLNGVLAGAAGVGALWGGTALTNNSNIEKQFTRAPQTAIVQTAEIKPELIKNNETKQKPEQKTQITKSWTQQIAIPFIIDWEGKITDENGMHVLYDDDVRVPTNKKRRWDGKGGQDGIDEFIKSCLRKTNYRLW